VSELDLQLSQAHIFSYWIFQISSRTWLVYLAIAILGASNLGLINIALKLTNPVLVSFTRYSDIIVAYLIQVVVFHEAASMMGVGGSVCIILSLGLLKLENKFNYVFPDSLKCLF
jgi:drug/metabolite transporter (DMT)-like permease